MKDIVQRALHKWETYMKYQLISMEKLTVISVYLGL